MLRSRAVALHHGKLTLCALAAASLLAVFSHPALKKHAEDSTMLLAKIILAQQLHLAPYHDSCPPGAAIDPLNGKCYQKVYNPGQLCGYSESMSSSLYDWDATSQSCVPTGLSMEDPYFRFQAQGAYGAFSSWWEGKRQQTVLTYDIEAYNGATHFTGDLNKDGAPIGAGYFKPRTGTSSGAPKLDYWGTDAPYSVEEELRKFIRRYPGMLPDGGDDYFVRPAPGGAPMIGTFLVAKWTQLAERGLTKFCMFMEAPAYTAPYYTIDYIDEFNSYMQHVPNRTIAKYWHDHPLSAASLCEHTASGAAANLRQCAHPGAADDGGLVLKAWARASGLPKPTCTGSDGKVYPLHSTSPTSPWIEFIVSPNNPSGEIRQCNVPSDRCQIDAAYNYAMYYIRGGLDPANLQIPYGTDGLPAAHIYYSFTKYFGSASTRWGFAASSETDVWNRVARVHQQWRTVIFDLPLANWFLMAATLRDESLGPYSDMEVNVARRMREYDALMMSYVPDDCPCLQILNRHADGVLGGYYWMQLKDACATMPVEEGYAPNMYIHLGDYFRYAPHLMIATRASQFTDASQLYDPVKTADPSSVWHSWAHTHPRPAKKAIGEEPWDRGALPGDMGSWARFTRMHFMNSDDAYVRVYLKRVGYICGVNAPRGFLGPVEFAKLDPTLVVDENVGGARTHEPETADTSALTWSKPYM